MSSDKVGGRFLTQVEAITPARHNDGTLITLSPLEEREDAITVLLSRRTFKGQCYRKNTIKIPGTYILLLSVRWGLFPKINFMP